MDGNTDMDVLLQTNGIEFAEDQLSLALGGPMKGSLFRYFLHKNYQWYNPETGGREERQNCLIPVSEKDIFGCIGYLMRKSWHGPKTCSTRPRILHQVNIEAFMKLDYSASLIFDGKVLFVIFGCFYACSF